MYVRCAFAVFTVAVSAVECGGCAVSAAGMQFRQRSSRRVCRYVGVCMQSSPALHSVADGGPVLEYLPRQQCVCVTQLQCVLCSSLKRIRIFSPLCFSHLSIPPHLPPSLLSLHHSFPPLCFLYSASTRRPIACFMPTPREYVRLHVLEPKINVMYIYISLT